MVAICGTAHRKRQKEIEDCEDVAILFFALVEIPQGFSEHRGREIGVNRYRKGFEDPGSRGRRGLLARLFFSIEH